MARKRKKPESDESPGGGSSWMVTFSDLSTLLLTFFVLLLSMSSLNKMAFRTSFQNFTSSSGTLMFRDHERVAMPKDMIISEICKSLESVHVLDVRELDEVSEKDFSDQELNLVVSSGSAVWTRRDKKSDTFSFIFGEKLMFESGTAELNPKAHEVLDTISKLLAESEFKVYIDGHTDDLPTAGDRFASNEDLSLARAEAVLDYFTSHGQVPYKRLAIAGYGSARPLVDNRLPAGRAMNRRVEIIFEKPRR